MRDGWADGAITRVPDKSVQVWIRFLESIGVEGTQEEIRHRAKGWAEAAHRSDPLITRYLRKDLQFRHHYGFFPWEARTPEQCAQRDDWQERGILHEEAVCA